MSIASHSYPKRAANGFVAALTIGLTVVGICNTVWAIAGDFPIMTLWDEASVGQVLLASFPYLFLSICGISARRPWIAGLCLTAAFWGYYLWDITHYEGGGANIGLGIVMIFSPIPITAGSLLALATLSDGRRADDMAGGR